MLLSDIDDDLQKNRTYSSSIFPQLEKEKMSRRQWPVLPSIVEVTREDLIWRSTHYTPPSSRRMSAVTIYVHDRPFLLCMVASEDAFVAEMNAQAVKTEAEANQISKLYRT